MWPETIIENIELIKCWWIVVQIDHYQIDIKTEDKYERIFIKPSELLEMISKANKVVEERDILLDSIWFLQGVIRGDIEWGAIEKENWEDMTLDEMKQELRVLQWKLNTNNLL